MDQTSSYPRSSPHDAPDVRLRGVVRMFNREKGYGFIVPRDADLKDRSRHMFVHMSDVQPVGYLAPGDAVAYEIDVDSETRAVRVRKL